MSENKNRVQRGQTWSRRRDGYRITIVGPSPVPGQWTVQHPEGQGTPATILESTIVESFDLVRDPLAEAAAILASPEATIKHVHYGVDDPVVIGVGGYKTSGKDAFAQALETHEHFVRRGMSDPLAEWALALNPWIRVDAPNDEPGMAAGTATGPFYDLIETGWPRFPEQPSTTLFMRYEYIAKSFGYDWAKKIPDFRDHLQRNGTEAGRGVIGENVWVDVAAGRIMGDLAFGRNVVITGIRYENEISMIRDFGGVAVWVDRPVITKVHEAALACQDPLAQHSSEVTLKAEDFDLVLVNDGTLDDLAAQAKQIADHVYTIPRRKQQSGPERVREAIRQDRGGDAPLTPLGFA